MLSVNVIPLLVFSLGEQCINQTHTHTHTRIIWDLSLCPSNQGLFFSFLLPSHPIFICSFSNYWISTRHSIKRQGHHFADKGSCSQNYGFSSSHVWKWETIKKADNWRIHAFKLWCWRRHLRVLWTARRSILKEINPEYSLEELVLKLKLQYFGHLTWRADSLEKTLILGKTEGKRRRGQRRIRWLDSITDSMDINLRKLREIMEERGIWHAAIHGVSKSQTWLSNQITTRYTPTTVLCTRLEKLRSCSPYLSGLLHSV